MQAFATLLDSLAYTQSRNRKEALLAQYFKTTADPDRGWALAVLTDGLPLRMPLRRMLADLTGRFIDPVLYRLSRDYVGDTAETVSLLWRDDGNVSRQAPSLNDAVVIMSSGNTAERTEALGLLLSALDANGRFALLKLLGGAPRVGVSARLAKSALAAAFNVALADIEEIWHALEPPYASLFAWLEGRGSRPDPGVRAVFRPVMLAHPIEEEDWPRLVPAEFAAEWKWDGIRVQIAAQNGQARIFSRQGDDIAAAFPEIVEAYAPHTCVVDGELLVLRSGVVAPFNDLQQRLNRKAVTARMMRDYPAHIRLYDLLFDNGVDLRPLPFTERRARLERWFSTNQPMLTDVSSLVPFSSFDDLTTLWTGARDSSVEGLMLKRRDSVYQAGRVKGLWFKWKRAALTLDCVLMYAQRGSGKRSSFYSDYTFGVWQGEPGSADAALVPVGKAYSGFTDEELRRLDKWVRDHTVETFGPVRAVTPGLVLEVAFDAVQPSTRHKSGLAMRFPRIHRIRWDKPANEADTLATVRGLVGRA